MFYRNARLISALAGLALAIVFCLAKPAGADDAGSQCPFLDAPQPLLNSERIERCFGHYGIELQPGPAPLRIARLYSETNGQRQTRTLAITRLADNVPAELEPVMASIRSGASIGATLTRAGWRVDKPTFTVDEIAASPSMVNRAGFQGLGPDARVAIHAYRLVAVRGETATLFARILEVHDPGYLRLPDLELLFGPAGIAEEADRQFLEVTLGWLQEDG